MGYAGGKGRLWQELVSLMPPHETYIETHLGGGAVLRNKKSSSANIGIDIDPQVIAVARDWNIPNLCLYQADAVAFLESYEFCGTELVYADPPYVSSTKSGRRYYRHECSDEDHVRLIAALRKLICPVLISGYQCALYDELLQGWHRKELVNVTRGGRRVETVWANFEFSDVLQDYSCIGSTFRERERIRRKIDRWVRKLQLMPSIERRALLRALDIASVISGDEIRKRPANIRGETHG